MATTVEIPVIKKLNKVSIDINKNNHLSVLKMVIRNMISLRNKFESIDIINIEQDDKSSINTCLFLIDKLFLAMDKYKEDMLNITFENNKKFIMHILSILYTFDRLYIRIYVKYYRPDLKQNSSQYTIIDNNID